MENAEAKLETIMDTQTGQIYTAEEVNALFKDIPKIMQKNIVPIIRDLTKLEETTMQLRKYAPCGCGSGKKFKFCCYKGAV